MKQPKNKNNRIVRMADPEFGLKPIPPISNPFGSSRGPTTEIMWLPIAPNPINVATTSYASSLNFTAAGVSSFANYAAVWEEYVVRAVEWEWISCGTQVGTMKAYVDEADNTNPTATTSQNHVGFVAPCNGASGFRKKLRWVAKDTGDETWTACSNTSKFLTALKVYSNTANWGLVGTTECVALVNGLVCIQFRTQGGP